MQTYLYRQHISKTAASNQITDMHKTVPACCYLVHVCIPANEDVRTTLLMVDLDLATLSKTVDVPLSAGSTSSFCVSSQEAKKGDAM